MNALMFLFGLICGGTIVSLVVIVVGSLLVADQRAQQDGDRR